MQIVDVRQGSPEWKALRLRRLCASEAPAILGLSKYKTREALLREKSTGIAPEIDPATQKRFDDGHASEAMARPIVEIILGVELFPATATLDVDGLPLLASYDGVSMGEDVLWENKLANSNNNGDLAALIDAEHWPQLEAQMLGADASAHDGARHDLVVDYVAYHRRHVTQSELLERVEQLAPDRHHAEPADRDSGE